MCRTVWCRLDLYIYVRIYLSCINVGIWMLDYWPNFTFVFFLSNIAMLLKCSYLTYMIVFSHPMWQHNVKFLIILFLKGQKQTIHNFLHLNKNYHINNPLSLWTFSIVLYLPMSTQHNLFCLNFYVVHIVLTHLVFSYSVWWYSNKEDQ